MRGKTRGTYAAAALPDGDVRQRRAVRFALRTALVLAAIVAVLSLVPSFAPGRSSARGSPGRLSGAHTAASLSCASCHEAKNLAAGVRGAALSAAAASCTSCHDAATHQSKRAGHRALQASAEHPLTCVTCHGAHDAHGDAVDVHLAKDLAVVWRGSGTATIPLAAAVSDRWVPVVSSRACATCHDLSNARDPVRRCLDGALDSCFDEHAAALPTAAVAAVRHAVERATPDALVSSTRAELTAPPLEPALAAGALALALAAYVAKLRPRRGLAKLSSFAAVATKVGEPPDVGTVPSADRRRLPVIDASRCLGCRACVDACAFDVLEISRFVAVVARPDACCSAIVCAEACPNGSLTLVDGGRAEDRARIDARCESPDAPGVFLAGDLTGVPLIKNAIRQGREVADRVASGGRSKSSVHDLLIVGAGPAGLSATLRATELGLSVVTLEQGELASSIRAFPRGKLVFERPLTLPLEGDLWMEECTKEDLILQWERIVRTRRLPIRVKHRVVSVARNASDDGYTVRASRDDGDVTFDARHVLFAVGTRGTPRTLEAPIDPAATSRVAYGLVDAVSFAGKRVVVVGLGDAAMEAALALTQQPGCDVTVLHRAADFTRGSARNVAAMRAAVGAGRLKLHFAAKVRAVNATTLELSVASEAVESREISFDQLFVMVGGSPPWPLLAAAGVALRKDADDFRDPPANAAV